MILYPERPTALCKPPHKQCGSALISALFMMTLIAIAATAMSLRLRFDIHQTQWTITSDELFLASQYVTFWAMGELENKKNHFHNANPAGDVARFPQQHEQDYPDTHLEGVLIDLQGRHNINNFKELHSFSTLYQLLQDPAIKGSNEEKKELVLNFYQWLSPHQPHSQSTLDSFYPSQKPPYLAAHQAMTSPSEMRLVKDNTPAIQEILLQRLVALPEKTPLNLYTASPPALKALGNGLKNEQINEIISKRQEEGFNNQNTLNALLKKLAIRPESITTESQYFLCMSKASRNDLDLTVFTVLKRDLTKKDKITVSIVRQSFNAL